MMTKKEEQAAVEKPKVRVTKADQRLKTGTIRVEDPKGTLYRTPCDRCEAVVTLHKPPSLKDEVVCKACWPVSRHGKPSTKVLRKGDKRPMFLTECDICGEKCSTSYMPKKEVPFLCGLCFVESDEGRALQRQKLEAMIAKEQKLQASASESAATDTTLSGSASSDPKPDPDRAPKPQYIPRYTHSCKSCRKKLNLHFRPKPNERLVCPECYAKESAQEEKRKDRPSTRILFNMECIGCGKTEIVDFVPKSLSEPMCAECFEKKWRK